MSAAGSVDPNGTIVSYAWSFGDGAASATGVSTTHAFAQDGDYTVRLITMDNDGLADTLFTTAHVTNVAPVIAPIAGDTLIVGETYAKSGSFADPGADPWTATVNYGDGSGTSALALSGKTFSLSHMYAATGTFTVTVRVSDDDATSSRTATVLVWSPSEGVQGALDIVKKLADAGTLSDGRANSLMQKLDAALKQLSAGKPTPALNQLAAAENELDAMVSSGQLSGEALDPLRSLVSRLIAMLGR